MPRYGRGYEHVDDAAAAALMALEFQPRVDGQEYMGLLVKDPETGLTYRTNFQTKGSRDSSEWTGYPDGKVVGVAHNHPAPRTGQNYPGTHLSVQDLNTARQMGVPSYVAAVAELKGGRRAPASQVKYTPNTKTKATAPRAGEELLAQFPIEEFLQFIAAKRSREYPTAARIIAERNSRNPLLAAEESSRGNPTRR